MELALTKDWTLFLDRDGVINEELPGTYVNHLDEFTFYPNAVAAISILSQLFCKTIVVTNQKGVGRGITPLTALESIHHHLTAAVEAAGGTIHRIYFCPDLENDSPNRKPNPGMAFQAAKDFPEIDLTRGIMVGNNSSDMHFGRSAGMGCNVILTTTNPLNLIDPSIYDLHFASLYDAALFLQGRVKK